MPYFYFITGFLKGACPRTLVVSVETLTLKDGDYFPVDTELLIPALHMRGMKGDATVITPGSNATGTPHAQTHA